MDIPAPDGLENSINNLPFVTRINVFKTFCREGYGFGDNIYFFDTFTITKKAKTEIIKEPQKYEKEVSLEVKDSERLKAPSPSAYEWSKLIPELSNVHGLNNWKDICQYLKISVGSDSARRRLKKWVEDNKSNWAPVPDA